MSIQKKSLISALKTTKKANIAKEDLSSSNAASQDVKYLQARRAELQAGKVKLQAGRASLQAGRASLQAGKLKVQAGKLKVQGGKS